MAEWKLSDFTPTLRSIQARSTITSAAPQTNPQKNEPRKIVAAETDDRRNEALYTSPARRL
jgi:hypothetical protein